MKRSANASRGLNWSCFKMSTMMGRVVIRRRSPVPFSGSCRGVEQSTPARASSRSFAACNEATALCGPPHWPRPILEPSVFLPTMSGAGGPCAHTWFGDRSPGIRMSVWGRWHPLRPQTSWVGRLLAGELTPKLAAEALQRLGTLGRALRAHWTGRKI